MATKTYDFKKVKVTLISPVLGAIAIRGFAPETGISAKRDDANYTKTTGADGEVTRSKTNGKAGEVTFTLEQSSKSNDDLSRLGFIDETTGAGICVLNITDLGGTTLLNALTAWIEKPADAEFAKKSGPRVWKFDTGDMDYFLGGNN